MRNYFFVDIWGVLYEKNELYSGVKNSLKSIKDSGKKVILMSNTTRTHEEIQIMFEDCGIERSLYTNIVTSADVLYKTLELNANNGYSTYGKTYCYIGARKNTARKLNIKGYVQHLDYGADIEILILESLKTDDAKDKYKLEIIKNLPMNATIFCMIPDKPKTKMINGKLVLEKYIVEGRIINYTCKPYGLIYSHTLQVAGIAEGNTEKILAVGDTFHKDIMGACGASIDSCMTCTGWTTKMLGLKESQTPSQEELDRLISVKESMPTYIVKGFYIA